ncbi:hypothetical protein L1887_09202 [Cichorium endivia]|nr:hypothetical protein L1887_09202 [Cichorium endivia]
MRHYRITSCWNSDASSKNDPNSWFISLPATYDFKMNIYDFGIFTSHIATQEVQTKQQILVLPKKNQER